MIDNENKTDLLMVHPDEEGSDSQSPGGFSDWLRRTLPMALIFVGLLGLAWWGHHTGWKFAVPKSESPGVISLATVAADDSPYSRSWCEEHGVHGCPLHHPSLAQTDKPPVVTKEDFERAKRALSVRPRPENQASCVSPGYRVRFETANAIETIGVASAAVEQAELTEAISASGEVIFDPSRSARLASRVAGTARYVAKKVGDTVQAGDVLAVVDAAEVGKAKADFLQALVQVRLKTKALSNLKAAVKSVSERQVKEAEAGLRDAEARLLGAEQGLVNLGLPARAADFQAIAVEEVARRIQLLGVPKTLVENLQPQTATANLLPIRAPFDGVVLTSDVIAGEVVDTGKVLFVVVDPRYMWVTLSVGPSDAAFVTVGRKVGFRPDGIKEDFTGTVTWVGTASHETTRRVPVRVELDNTDGRLRASTLGTGRIILREEPSVVFVPNDAVQSDGGCQIVFVRNKDFFKSDGPKEFIVRTVRTGVRDNQKTEIIAGVLPNEVVAGKGSNLLLGELKKSEAVRHPNRGSKEKPNE